MPAAVKIPRILIVEDENIVALDIQAQLRKLGYESIGHVAHGQEAINVAKAQRPDLILMDIQLAGDMDGIAAAQIIRTECDLPVVFITAYDADEILARAKLTEPYGYVLKPFSERELHNVIEMALYKHHAETKLRMSMEQLQNLSRRLENHRRLGLARI